MKPMFDVQYWASAFEPGFLGMPEVSGALFTGLTFAAFATTYISFVTGTAGGLMLLVIMAPYFSPAILVPLQTAVQLGATSSRSLLMLKHMMWPTLLPFVIGAVIGAALGARIFLEIPTSVLRTMMAVFVLVVIWMPEFGRLGADAWRFGIVGFLATFIGVFVSATGSLVSPIVAAASPDRRNFAATVATLMTMTHILKIAAFLVLGVAIGVYLPLIAAMIAGTIAGNYVGRFSMERMKEHSFRLIFKIVMTILAIRLLWLAYTSG